MRHSQAPRACDKGICSLFSNLLIRIRTVFNENIADSNDLRGSDIESLLLKRAPIHASAQTSCSRICRAAVIGFCSLPLLTFNPQALSVSSSRHSFQAAGHKMLWNARNPDPLPLSLRPERKSPQTLSTLNPKSKILSPDGQAHVLWKRRLEAGCRARIKRGLVGLRVVRQLGV